LKKLFTPRVVVLATFMLLFSACHKKKTIEVSGRYLKNCSTSTPIANRPLKISYTRHSSWVSSYQNVPNAGSGTTDANGNFKFIFANEYSGGEWTLVDSINGKRYIINIDELTKNGLVLGNVYADTVNYSAKLNISIKDRILASDTLFIRFSDSTTVIYPVVEQKYTFNYQFYIIQGYGGYEIPNRMISKDLRWGIGIANFNKADSIHKVYILFSPCSDPVYENQLEVR
jgi:hypothetical protein